jgi:hypothetical protein
MLLALAVLGGLIVAGCSAAPEGARLPVPPEQNTPWNPPETKLPEVSVTATEALFRQGLADPRGCEYREIEVFAQRFWVGGSSAKETHGWVFPAEPGEKQRFAVCWNGLVYPAAPTGERADLRADVEELLAKDRDFVEKQLALHEQREADHKEERLVNGEKYYRSLPRIRWGYEWPEAETVSHSRILPVKAVLLLRLGHADLAEELWSQWFAGREEEAGRDPYLMLAREWAGAIFDRAVGAHLRGDDESALATARMLARARKRIEAEAERRGFERPCGETDRPYVGFLEPLPALLADQERRARAPKRERVLDVGLDKYPDRQERIAALIRDFEESTRGGGIWFGEEPVIDALIKEGDAAVEPLLRCLVEDDRLTRAERHGMKRPPAHYHSLIPVREKAYRALQGIARTRHFDPGTPSWKFDDKLDEGTKARKYVADRIRAYWKKFGTYSPQERWYRVLMDDEASSDQWCEAAREIIRPTNVCTFPAALHSGSWRIGEKPTLRGEMLRRKTAPTVSELLVKRMREASARLSDERDGGLRSASGLAFALAAWDGEAHLGELRWFGEVLQDRIASGGEESYSRLVDLVASVHSKRIELRDTRALDEYVAWARQVRSTRHGKKLFEPFWRHPDHPAVLEASEWLFNDGASPWAALIEKQGLAGEYGAGMELLETPLLGVAGFRRRIIAELSRKEQVGVAVLRRDGAVRAHYPERRSGPGGFHKGDPLAPEPGSKVAVRRCDLCAWKLSESEGTPRCELYWPTAKRDEAIAACKAFLTQYGDRFKYGHDFRRRDEWPPSKLKPLMAFPQADHPATAEDVRSGLAVFSLEGEGEVRLWKMPEFPMKARWGALKDYPKVVTRQAPDTGKMRDQIEYEQDGLVWQAEEVLKDGKWERYYGFAGKYCVSKVPATEIESDDSKRTRGRMTPLKGVGALEAP